MSVSIVGAVETEPVGQRSGGGNSGGVATSKVGCKEGVVEVLVGVLVASFGLASESEIHLVMGNDKAASSSKAVDVGISASIRAKADGGDGTSEARVANHLR